VSKFDIARELLASCSARLDVGSAAGGTAFFVSPRYAITAAHVAGGVLGLTVRLSEGEDCWEGQVADVRPAIGDWSSAGGEPCPAPDLALIRIRNGPEHGCALLGGELKLHARVLARGYTLRFPADRPTAETERFKLSGDLETPCPGCTLLKLGRGEVARGMSGAPVLDLGGGAVIGMLRTSRLLDSDLGGWVVPAGVIRESWPEVAAAHDRFHEHDTRWRRRATALTGGQHGNGDGGSSAPAPFIGKARIDTMTVITGDIGTVNMHHHGGSEARPGRGAC
jgi:hypothetical protein